MIYFTGDTHADEERLSRQALKNLTERDALIICGDFGFIWDNSLKERKALAKLSKRACTICFVDGTHENFDLLNDYPLVMWHGGKVHKIAPNIYHLMRGQVFEIQGKKLFTLGGGDNPELQVKDDEEISDRPEVPDRNQMLEGVNNLEKYRYQVDYIVTHEPPAKIRDFLNLPEQRGVLGITALGAYLDELAVQTKFKKWYFGSLHTDKYVSAQYTSVFHAIINAETGERVN